MQTDRVRGRFDRAYEVDVHAVADAIVARLLAGRAFGPLPVDDC